MNETMDDGMDESYAAPVKAPEEPAADNETVDQENTEEQTALIPNKILSPDGEPINEGDEIVVQVVKNYGDESEVKYAPKKGGGEETGTTPSADEELTAMDKSGGGY